MVYDINTRVEQTGETKMEKLLNAINKELQNYRTEVKGLKIDDILKNGIIYLSDKEGNTYAARKTPTGKYKKDSFHLMRSFLNICYC